jgi:hypothetical protein
METAGNTETGSTLKGTSEEKHAPSLTREQVLRLSSSTIRQLHKRVSGTRFKEQSGDSARLSHIRALSQLLQTYAGILKDTEISTLDQRITELERQKEMRQRS